ncbi:MAG: hypothetical protein NTZ44_01455 [Candidatus Nomurabacteria bacterium]|nr:hypothetical protein [Candidatus Nomurabacteria bacterium]
MHSRLGFMTGSSVGMESLIVPLSLENFTDDFVPDYVVGELWERFFSKKKYLLAELSDLNIIIVDKNKLFKSKDLPLFKEVEKLLIEKIKKAKEKD